MAQQGQVLKLKRAKGVTPMYAGPCATPPFLTEMDVRTSPPRWGA